MNEYEQSYYDALVNMPYPYIGAIQYEYTKEKPHIPGYTEFKKSPIHIIPDTIYGEVFLQIVHSELIPNIMPGRYYISNFGRVFDMCGMKYLPGSYNGNGYLKVKLTCIKSNTELEFKDIYIHQLVNYFFNYPKLNEEYKCIHKDLDKSNNRADNLEWKTEEEKNYYQMYMEAQMKLDGTYVEKKYKRNGNMSEQTAEKVCELLSQGISDEEIMKKLGVSSYSIHELKYRRTWPTVNQKYDY